MAVLRDIRAKSRLILPPVVAISLMGYFAYHSIQGERGYRALLQVRQELAEARSAEARLAEERRRLENRVNLLRPDALDPDMLAERARLLLNYGKEDEYTVLMGEPEQSK